MRNRKEYFNFFSEKEKADEYLDQHDFKEYPEKCPHCEHAIDPEYIMAHDPLAWLGEIDLLCRCPRKRCGEMFFVKFDGFQDKEDRFIIEKIQPLFYKSSGKEFSEEIESISPQFTSIHTQSKQAEHLGLESICGVGYRKALEYLIKDYLIHLNPEITEKIKGTSLGNCIKHHIIDVDIKEMAERAVWLGNDETHYERVWKDRDLEDLKSLLEIVLHYITMDIKKRKYLEGMVDKKKEKIEV